MASVQIGRGTQIAYQFFRLTRKTPFISERVCDLKNYFLKFSCMAAAARRPSPIARITVAPPRTMSPPAKIVGMDVCILSFTAIVFLRPNSNPLTDFGTMGLGDTPTATTARSISNVTVSPGMAIGLPVSYTHLTLPTICSV